MRIAVAAERVAGETRVALVPDLVGRLREIGAEVVLEPGAGAQAGFADEAYVAAGARIDPAAFLAADVVLGVQPLSVSTISSLRPGAATISFFPAAEQRDRRGVLADRQVQAFAMEQVPRISRAQPMDALTSQALVVGYRAVLVAADLYPRFLGLCVTAAGTVPPAQVLVLGAGVVGLQAMATARRLGAVVSGYDVRSTAAEEIASLGATPVDLGLPVLAGAAGYTREMSPQRTAEQHRLLAPYVAGADIVIATAAVPDRTPPLWVTAAMVAAMRPGSVVVDVVAGSGGNVEGVRAGELLQVGGVQLWGGADVANSMPAMASSLYAQNVVNLLVLMTRPGDRQQPAVFAPDLTDVIIDGALVRPTALD